MVAYTSGIFLNLTDLSDLSYICCICYMFCSYKYVHIGQLHLTIQGQYSPVQEAVCPLCSEVESSPFLLTITMIESVVVA